MIHVRGARDVFHEWWYIFEPIFIPNNMCQNGYVWILGLGLYRVIGLRDSHMWASTVLLTNKSSASTVNVPSMTTIKIEPSGDDVLMLLDSDEDVYHVVDLSDTSPYPYKLSLPIRFWSLWMLIKPFTIRRIWNWFVIVLRLNVHLLILLHRLQVSILSMH